MDVDRRSGSSCLAVGGIIQHRQVCGEKIVRMRMAMMIIMMMVRMVKMMDMTITMKKLRSVRLAHCC